MYIQMYPGKVVLHFKRASHFHQSKPSLDVDEDPLLFFFIAVQTEIGCGNKSLLT